MSLKDIVVTIGAGVFQAACIWGAVLLLQAMIIGLNTTLGG